MARWLTVVVFVLGMTSLSAAAATSLDVSKLRFPVTKTVLPNGLTILMHENHSAPTVSYQTWFRVGSKNEEPGFTGIAHLFEHMMFKGAKRYSGKEFDTVLHANGVTNNAFTTYDYTGYFEDLPSDKLKLIIDIESDRLENLRLNEENLKSEREVVKEERRWRVDNSITGVLTETLWSNAYHVHPYKWPVIGWMKDIDAIDLERCKQFFHTYYSVSNAVIVVVGDINPDQTLAWIKEYYGKLPKVDVPPLKAPSEPPQTKEIKAKAEKMAQNAYVALGYHIGRQGENDSYVMDLISNILTEGPSSRLYKKFVYNDQVALGVDGASVTPQDPGLFEVILEVKPGIKGERVSPLLTAEIESMAQFVTNAELEKAKNQVMKHWVDSVKTSHGQAKELVVNEIVTGSYENLFDDLLKYQKVTLADVKRVAQKYLVKNNRTVVTLVPQKGAMR